MTSDEGVSDPAGRGFRALVNVGLAPELKRAAFKKKDRLWLRLNATFWQMVHVQTRLGNSSEILVTLNVGIASTALRDLTVGWKGDEPSAWNWHISWRLGELLTDRPPADYWWMVDASTDIDQLSRKFAAYVNNLVLPRLDEFSVPTAFVNELRRRSDPLDLVVDSWLKRLGEPHSELETPTNYGADEDEALAGIVADAAATLALTSGTNSGYLHNVILTPRVR